MIKGSDWLINRINLEIDEADAYLAEYGKKVDTESVLNCGKKAAIKSVLTDIRDMYKLGVLSGVVLN